MTIDLINNVSNTKFYRERLKQIRILVIPILLLSFFSVFFIYVFKDLETE
jgi:hypothetical protein